MFRLAQANLRAIFPILKGQASRADMLDIGVHGCREDSLPEQTARTIKSVCWNCTACANHGFVQSCFANRSAGTVLPAQTTDLSSPALRLPRLALPECPQRAESDAGYLNPRFPPCNRVFSRSMYPKMSVSTYVCATAPRECIHLQIKRAYFWPPCSPYTLRCNRVFSRSMYPKMSVSTYVCATAPRECIHLQIKRAYFWPPCSPYTLRQINLS